MTGPTERHLDAASAGALVLASMVGVGVFTTAGYQAHDLQNAPAILMAWGLGGLAAGCGALAYAELVAALPDNGGEMALLGRIYHRDLGLTAGLVSLVAGFAAPLAATAIAFERYACRATSLEVPSGSLAVALIAFAALGPLFGARFGDRVQRISTLGKLLLLLGFIVVGVISGRPERWLAQPRPLQEALLAPEFAVGLVYVSYAYTGWNAAAYVAGEVENPARNLPRALLGGTLVVGVLYLGVHLALLGLAPLQALDAQVEVADAAVRFALGGTAASVLSGVIAFGLWSTAAALLTTGTAVAVAMGERVPMLRWTRLPSGSTTPAVTALAVVGAVLAATASFETILTYTGITLGFFSGAAVLGVFLLRHREPDLLRPYRAWGHPFTTLFHLAVVAWMIGFVVWDEPLVGVVGSMVLGGTWVLARVTAGPA